jgi:hypothetical protein
MLLEHEKGEQYDDCEGDDVGAQRRGHDLHPLDRAQHGDSWGDHGVAEE